MVLKNFWFKYLDYLAFLYISTIKVWNINFFNFYKGGTEVLLHSKWYNQDNAGFDPESNSFILVVDNMDIKAHPT